MTPLALALRYAGRASTGERHHPHLRAMSPADRLEALAHCDRLSREADARRRARNRRRAAR